MHNNTKNQQNLFFVGFIFLICLFLVRKRHIYIHLFLVRKSICYKHTRSFRQKSISIYFTFLYFTLSKNVNIFFIFVYIFTVFVHIMYTFFYHSYHFPKTAYNPFYRTAYNQSTQSTSNPPLYKTD